MPTEHTCPAKALPLAVSQTEEPPVQLYPALPDFRLCDKAHISTFSSHLPRKAQQPSVSQLCLVLAIPWTTQKLKWLLDSYL